MSPTQQPVDKIAQRARALKAQVAHPMPRCSKGNCVLSDKHEYSCIPPGPVYPRNQPRWERVMYADSKRAVMPQRE